jgi:hypothetical protein
MLLPWGIVHIKMMMMMMMIVFWLGRALRAWTIPFHMPPIIHISKPAPSELFFSCQLDHATVGLDFIPKHTTNKHANGIMMRASLCLNHPNDNIM